MKRTILTYKDALYICRNADQTQMAEWNAALEFKNPEGRAKEIIDWSPLKWCIKLKDRPVAMFGTYRVTDSTLTAWCMTVKGVPKKVWGYMAQQSREAIRAIFQQGKTKRIHAYICRDRPASEEYANKVGFLVAADLEQWGGEKDFYLMATTQKGYAP